MPLSRNHRYLLAALLCNMLLLYVFACGLGHGQSSALKLSGLQGEFCGTDKLGSPSPLPSGTASLENSCPLCNHGSLIAAPLTGWNLNLISHQPVPSPAWHSPPSIQRTWLLSPSRAPPTA